MKKFIDIIEESLLDEGKKAYEMKGPYELKKVGVDANGNWSYWVSKSGKTKKVQHGALHSGSIPKISKDDLKNWKASDHMKTIDAVISYIEKYSPFK